MLKRREKFKNNYIDSLLIFLELKRNYGNFLLTILWLSPSATDWRPHPRHYKNKII